MTHGEILDKVSVVVGQIVGADDLKLNPNW